MDRIVERLLADDGRLIQAYFKKPRTGDNRIDGEDTPRDDSDSVNKWIQQYGKQALRSIDHDEPWVTLVALYGLFGDQSDLDVRAELLEALVEHAFPESRLKFDSLSEIHVEHQLPEIRKYRHWVKNELFVEGPYHLYPDRSEKIESKLGGVRGSFEGPTHLDVLISGKSGGRHVHLFIEAKFLSDISKDILYVPARNQIARNIDSAMDLMTHGGDDPAGLMDFRFLLLTPGIFRTERFGGPVASPLRKTLAERSRLYCYKMDDYAEGKLPSDLPHWRDDLEDADWEILRCNTGWLCFEDFHRVVNEAGTLAGDELDEFNAFFRARRLDAS